MYTHDLEKLLIHRLRQGDEKAFEMIYNHYWEKLLSVAYHRIGSLETAKELVQDVFTNLWKRRNQLDIKTSFSAYLFSAIKYTILDHIRSSNIKQKYVDAILKSQSERDNATLELIAFRDLDEFLETEVAKLPEKCRLVFKLSRNEHYSNREIAEMLQISPKTVENQLSKALKILRVSLQEFKTYLLILLPFSL